jgi:hypothetical protein
LRRGDFAHGGTGILPVRTAKMAVPRLGCGPAALYHCPFFNQFSLKPPRWSILATFPEPGAREWGKGLKPVSRYGGK